MPTPPDKSAADNGELWILIRGLSRSAAHWGEFPSTLQGKISGAQVKGIDLPGNGIYHDLKTPLSVPEITEFLKRDFERILGERLVTGAGRPRCFLVSLSLGSMVAVDWTSRYPSDFAGCVLMNTSLASINPLFYRVRPQALPLLLRIFAESNIEKRERLILKLTSRFPERTSIAISSWVDLAKRFPVTIPNALRQFAAASRFRAPARPPNLPTLILSSKSDGLVDPRCSEAIQRKWKTPLQQHGEAGHDLPLDAPDWVIQQIVDWRLKLNFPV